MSGDSIRRRAAFAVAKSLANPKVRKMFDRNGYTSGQEIVTALESDTIEEVFQRIRRYTPPVTVAIYWPKSGRLEYASFEPGKDTAPRGREEVGGTSTIGMLFERINQETRRSLRFRLAWDASVGMDVAHYEAALS